MVLEDLGLPEPAVAHRLHGNAPALARVPFFCEALLRLESVPLLMLRSRSALGISAQVVSRCCWLRCVVEAAKGAELPRCLGGMQSGHVK